MELAILILLAQHESLAAEQLAGRLDQRIDDVQATLRGMRRVGLVDVLAVGELEGHVTTAAAYWRLSDEGQRELARRHEGCG